MGKKNKRKQELQLLPAEIEESSDEGPTPMKKGVLRARIEDDSSDEGPTPMKKRVLRVVCSDSDEEPLDSRRELRKRKGPIEDVSASSKKRKIMRCKDSSDEENVENASVATPRAERVNKLLEMQKKIQAKKKVSYDDSDSSEDENWLQEDEDSLPMWKHEEVPPEDVADNSESERDMDDFIVNDEDDMEVIPKNTKGKSDEDSDNVHNLSDAEQKLLKKKRKKRRRSKKEPEPEKIVEEESTISDDEKTVPQKKGIRTRKGKVESAPEKEAEETGAEEEETDNSSESSGEEIDYGNPYMQMDHAIENTNIIDLLSKNTDKDKKNAKKYKKEMGKYQYAVHSDRNKAAQVSNRARFAANMGTVKADRGFKAERNLDIKDSEYHDYQESCLFGERVRIFPHTKKYSKHKSKCALRGCGEPFSVGETRIIGVTKFSDINFQFMKKVNNFGKESFYYICERHCPKTGSDSEEYSSGEG